MEWRLLEPLDAAARASVLQVARRRSFDRGEVIFHEGDPGDTLQLIASGRVIVRVTTPDGETATLTVLGPGDHFGELALVSAAERRTATISCLEPTETLAISRDRFHDLRKRHPGVQDVLVTALARRVTVLSEHLLQALYMPVDRRIVRRLTALSRFYGGRPGTVIPLTQEDLAGLAGTTRPTVNQVLRQLEAEGIVALGRGRISVLDPDALRQRAR